MISREELNRIAQQTGLPLYQQEKDYFLKLFLYFYYRQSQEAVFKGGTCIKYLLGMERFSEDLDFNIKNPKKFKEEVQKIILDFQKIGINCSFLKEELFPDSYTCEIGVEGSLFQGTAQTRNRFKIDAGYRIGTLKKPQWNLIKSEYPESGDNFLVLTMALPEIMAEKIIALYHRKKGRDLYDLWFLIQAGVKLDRVLLNKKLKAEGLALEKDNILEKDKMVTKQEYERDLSRLSPRIIPYEQVRREVLNLLGKEKKEEKEKKK